MLKTKPSNVCALESPQVREKYDIFIVVHWILVVIFKVLKCSRTYDETTPISCATQEKKSIAGICKTCIITLLNVEIFMYYSHNNYV